jgi:hypothetical protein
MPKQPRELEPPRTTEWVIYKLAAKARAARRCRGIERGGGDREGRERIQCAGEKADGGTAAMRRSDEPIEPITLGNMRHNGVRSLRETAVNYTPNARAKSSVERM